MKDQLACCSVLDPRARVSGKLYEEIPHTHKMLSGAFVFVGSCVGTDETFSSP